MKTNNFVVRSLIPLLIGLGIVIGLNGTSLAITPTPDHTAHHPATPTSGSVCGGVAAPSGDAEIMDATSGPGTMTNMEFDLAFIDMMIPHHAGAIAMANVALERGEHEEIGVLAESIVVNQGQELDQLRAWRLEWYSDAPAMNMTEVMQMEGMEMMMPGMDMMSMDPSSEAAILCAASEPFDLAFISAMIPHHESAIMMAESALQHAVHPEIKELAHAIVDVQHLEIEEMHAWHTTWYGDSPIGTPAATTSATVVNVSLEEFLVIPSATDFQVGQTYQFVVTNNGALPHEFMILLSTPGIGQRDIEELHHIALAVISVDDLPIDATQKTDVTFLEEGTYELVCALPGHYDAGMKLMIEVRS